MRGYKHIPAVFNAFFLKTLLKIAFCHTFTKNGVRHIDHLPYSLYLAVTRGENTSFRVTKTRKQVSALSFNTSMTVDKELNFPELPFPHP